MSYKILYLVITEFVIKMTHKNSIKLYRCFDANTVMCEPSHDQMKNLQSSYSKNVSRSLVNSLKIFHTSTHIQCIHIVAFSL